MNPKAGVPVSAAAEAGAGASLQETIAALRRPQKSLPCKYFYDERGSRLFEEICGLEEYYLTRAEMAILEARAGEMAEALGADCALIEYGSSSARKALPLLDRMERPAAFVPVDISLHHLERVAQEVGARLPGLAVHPLCADFARPFALPPLNGRTARRAGFFPGSTIGNFTRREASLFLRRAAHACGPGGGLLIGVDLMKDVRRLEAAYNDRKGVTAAFNLNILSVLNRELGADFQPGLFRHRARFNPAESRIEMHLVSTAAHSVRLGGMEVRFEAGETIHTENCHKYTLEDFAALAAQGGLAVRRVWTDPARLFSLQYLEAAKG
ncbi:MAG: L-histidine N(alpha)-methyltransferase [Candidatus Tectomicrobia bacterium]|nr:L-histidine N(alpha)-methyltransferase [Candidatus Tectomicrobia bacterium]